MAIGTCHANAMPSAYIGLLLTQNRTQNKGETIDNQRKKYIYLKQRGITIKKVQPNTQVSIKSGLDINSRNPKKKSKDLWIRQTWCVPQGVIKTNSMLAQHVQVYTS